MLIETIVAVGLRVLGIFLAFTQIEVLSISLMSGQAALPPSYKMYFFFASFLLLIALILIVAPNKVSWIILSGIKTDKEEGSLSFRDLQFVAFGAIGTYMLVKTTMTLVGIAPSIASSGGSIPLRGYDLVMLGANFLIGTWLLCGAKGVRELVGKFRNAGVN